MKSYIDHVDSDGITTRIYEDGLTVRWNKLGYYLDDNGNVFTMRPTFLTGIALRAYAWLGRVMRETRP